MIRKHDNQYYIFSALILAVGDILALLLFTFFGTMEHQMDAGFTETFVITLPFALGWIIAGLFLGAFRSRAYATGGTATAAVVRTLILGIPLGLLLRWAMYGKEVSLVFALVTFAFSLLFLLLWRWAFTWLIKNI